MTPCNMVHKVIVVSGQDHSWRKEMKASALDRQAGSGGASPTRRRSLLLGAGVAGAAANAATTLPVGTGSDESVAQGGQPASDTQEGYRLTQHVLRYYETTKV
jgi:hypothetical protein